MEASSSVLTKKDNWYGFPLESWYEGKTDKQKKRLYAAEADFFLLDCQTVDPSYVMAILSEVLFKNKFIQEFGEYELSAANITFKDKIKSTAYSSDKQNIHIVFGKQYLPKFIVLHELAHCVAPNIVYHGRLFCKVYAEIVGMYYGPKIQTKFEKNLREFGVKHYHKSEDSYYNGIG